MSLAPKSYRVVRYDRDLQSVANDSIEGDGDADVIARVKAEGFGSLCEIWDGSRLVAELKAAA